jgi:hypothetical protein
MEASMSRLLLAIFLLLLLIHYSCKHDLIHSPLEAELMNCRESYEKNIAAQKLIGSWKIVAEGCAGCSLPDGLFDPPTDVSLVFDTLQRVIIYKDNFPTDTIPYVFTTTISDNLFWLDTGHDLFSPFVAGELVFCKDFIGFDSRAGDGAVYYFKKTN